MFYFPDFFFQAFPWVSDSFCCFQNDDGWIETTIWNENLILDSDTALNTIALPPDFVFLSMTPGTYFILKVFWHGHTSIIWYYVGMHNSYDMVIISFVFIVWKNYNMWKFTCLAAPPKKGRKVKKNKPTTLS